MCLELMYERGWSWNIRRIKEMWFDAPTALTRSIVS